MYWTNGVATLYHADAKAIPLPDASVHCVVTSPPYWGLRDYGLGAWKGGDPKCAHTQDRGGQGTSTIGGAIDGHQNAPWPDGVCGHCGAVKAVWEGGNNPNCDHAYRASSPRDHDGSQGKLSQGQSWPKGKCGKCGAVNVAAWEGGNADCDHTIRNPKTKRQTLSNSAAYREPGLQTYRGTCGRCGATQKSAGIGAEETLDAYIDNLIDVFREVWRVLRDDGSVWLNLGDAYAGSGGAHNEHHANPGISKSWERSGMPHYGNMGQPSRYLPPPGMKAKSVMGLPWRVAFALEADGWIMRSPIVWHKPNPMPESVRDRPTNAYEHIFLCVKRNTATFWTHRDGRGVRSKPAADTRYVDALDSSEHTERPAGYPDERIACPECDGKGEVETGMGQETLFGDTMMFAVDCEGCDATGEIARWAQINLWTAHDYFYDAEPLREPFSRDPATMRSGAGRKFTATPRNDGDKAARFDPEALAAQGGANARNVWTFPTQGRSDSHFATFPDELPRRCILAGTSEYGVCAECGAPWARRVERTAMVIDRSERTHPLGHTRSSGTMLKPPTAKSLGWQPTCECGDWYCATCAIVLESDYDEYNGQDSAMPSMRTNISMAGQADSTPVLQQGLLRQGAADSQSDLRRVPEGVSTRPTQEGQRDVLQQGVRPPPHGAESGDYEGMDADGAGLYSSPLAESSNGGQGRLCDGAPPSDGKGVGEESDAQRGSTSQERHQGRQSDTESSIASKGATRQPPEAGILRDVPTLPDNIPSERQCPRCGHGLNWQPKPIQPALVLDCFIGSGTTAAVAQSLGRRGVGTDLNTEYLDIAARRIAKIPMPMVMA